MSQTLDDLITMLDLEPIEENIFRGVSPKHSAPRVFGGQVVAQALAAMTHTVDPSRLCHSLHAFFLRPGDPKKPILYMVDRIRDGGSFTTRRVVAIQNGEAIFASTSSFQVAEEGPSHQASMPDVPSPEALGSDAAQRLVARGQLPADAISWFGRLPLDIRPIDSGPPDAPVVNVWMKTNGRLPDDPSLHRIVMAYASDLTLISASVKLHARAGAHPGVPNSVGGLQLASIDHAVWFHRPFRADEWLLYAQESPSTSGSRGFNRGLIFSEDGTLVASSAQEGLVRRLRDPGKS